jgi:sortase A
MARHHKQPDITGKLNEQHPSPRTIDPVSAIGVLLILIASTALITYAILIVPVQVAAQSGPPDEFRVAATRQAQMSVGGTNTPDGEQPTSITSGQPTQGSPATPVLDITLDADQITTTPNPAGDWPLPDWVEVAYWLSIPAIGLEAPIIALVPAEREVEGVPVTRLLVPNSFSVSWDMTSAEPGFAGNTILTGHHNVYGGVFGDLHLLDYGAEIAIWSEYGVFSYYVSVIEYLPEDDQPLEVRYQNAQWLNNTPDDRVTLITCWPNSTSTHRLIVVGTR